MTRVLSIIWVVTIALVATACGGDNGGERWTPPAGTPNTTPTGAAPTPTPDGPPTTLRVAYVNLESPLVIDENDRVAAETYAERLQMVIEELRVFDPDIVGVSEATWTKGTGQAWATIASGLGMEAQFGRANPWYPGQDQDASDQTRDLVGFEEGEAVLSRFPILEGTRLPLNPRTSESEGRIALRVTVLVPGIGEVNVYVARLSGDAATRESQAINLSVAIELTRGIAPRVVMVDLGFEPQSTPVQLFTNKRYYDAAAAAQSGAETGTCCRSQILAPRPGGTAAPGRTATLPGLPTPTPAAVTPTPAPPAPLARTSYILVDRWQARSYRLIADEPQQRADGSQLYASDHNGIGAVISIEEPGLLAPTPTPPGGG